MGKGRCSAYQCGHDHSQLCPTLRHFPPPTTPRPFEGGTGSPFQNGRSERASPLPKATQQSGNSDSEQHSAHSLLPRWPGSRLGLNAGPFLSDLGWAPSPTQASAYKLEVG